MSTKRGHKAPPLPSSVPCPPKAGDDFVPIIKPKPNETIDAVCVSQRMVGYLNHYVDGKIVPCYAPERVCPFCDGGQKPRWYGYLGVVVLPRRHRRVLTISLGAAQNSPTLAANDGKLRGLGIRLTRLGDGKNAPVKAVIGAVRERIDLPQEWDVARNLFAKWGILPAGVEALTTPAPTDEGLKEATDARKGRRRQNAAR